MSDHRNSTALPVVSIGGVNVNRITFKGAVVATFSQIDEIHQRPDGTAGRNFRENRDRFVPGEDFITEKLDVLRRGFPGVFPERGGGDVVLMTERGYFKLTKPMNDDRAWEVHGQMVDVYFAVRDGISGITALPLAPKLKAVGDVMHGFSRIAGLLGLKGNQRALSAAMATHRETGIDVLELTGVTHLKADISEQYLNSTSVGERTDPAKTANEINLILEMMGLQAAHRVPGKRAGSMKIKYWDLTDKGREAGGDFFDTKKTDHRGRPVKQIMWPTSVIALVQQHMEQGVTK